MADKVVETIKAASESGKIGDGKIFTLDLESATRIRTGETGANAEDDTELFTMVNRFYSKLTLVGAAALTALLRPLL